MAEDELQESGAERKMIIIPLNLNKLKTLIRMEPDDLLVRMMSPKLGFLERLIKGSLNDEMTKLLLKAISLICSSVHFNLLIDLLRRVLFSKFLKEDLFQYLNLCAVEKIKAEPDIFRDIIFVLKALMRCLPSKSLQSATMLTSQLKYIMTKETAVFASLEDMYQSLEDEMVEIRRQVHRGILVRDQERKDNLTVDVSEDFKRLTVVPTCEEIKGKCDPFLRENKIYQTYKNADDYLDVQFRLLKEDLVRPLREGLAELLQNREQGVQKKSKTNMKVYVGVEIVSMQISSNGLIYKIKFDVSRLRGVRWTAAKRLLPGSLVCLSADQFQTMLIGIVAESKAEDLCCGVTYLQFKNENNETNDLIFNRSYEMIESPAYFEPYNNVLKVLQYIEGGSLPFEAYLLNKVQDKIPPPKYLQRRVTQRYDFSSLVQPYKPSHETHFQTLLEYLQALFAPVLEVKSWPSADILGLDESQYKALQTALTKEFAVIQGPPGTGKTFLGLKIVQLLLYNNMSNALWEGPILIICYTNHALDQFLQEIIEIRQNDWQDKRIVRIGKRSSSNNSKLKDSLLENIRFSLRKGQNWHFRGSTFLPMREVRDLENRMMKSTICMELSRTEIISYHRLLHFMACDHFENTFTYLVWLRGGVAEPWMSDESEEKIRSHVYHWEVYYTDVFSDDEEEPKYTCVKSADEKYQETLEEIRSNGTFLRIDRYENFELYANLLQVKQAKVRFNEIMTELEYLRIQDIWQLPLADRWRLYNYWASRFVQERRNAVQTLLREHATKKKKVPTATLR